MDCRCILFDRSTKSDGIKVRAMNSAQLQTPVVDFRRSLHKVRRPNSFNQEQQTQSGEQSSYKGHWIYGQKVSVTKNTENPQKPALKEVSVPFRTPMSIVLGQHLRNTKAHNSIHAEYVVQAAKKEASQVLNLFSDRYKPVRGAYKADCDKNEAPVPRKERTFYIYGSPEKSIPLRKSSQGKSVLDNPHFEVKKKMTDEIAEELARRIRYRKKLGEKAMKIHSQRADYGARSNGNMKETKEIHMKTHKKKFEKTEADHREISKIREGNWRKLSQEESIIDNTKFVNETSKQCGLAEISNIKSDKTPFRHQIKQSTVWQELLPKNTVSKKTMLRILGESSVKKKVKKLFKELEREANDSDQETKKSRKVVICKTSLNTTSPKFLENGTTSEISRGTTVRSLIQDGAQEKAYPAGNWPGIENRQCHQRASASHKKSSTPHLQSSALLHQLAPSSHKRASASNLNTPEITGAIAKAAHPKERKFKPNLLDIVEEPNFDEKTALVETQCSDFKINCNEYVVDSFTPTVHEIKHCTVENTSEGTKAEGVDSEGFPEEVFNRSVPDGLGREWDLTSYDHQIVTDCKRKMMKLTLFTERKAEGENQNSIDKTDRVPLHETFDFNYYSNGKDEENNCGGDAGGTFMTGDNGAHRNVVRNKIQPGDNYDKIWTWQSD